MKSRQKQKKEQKLCDERDSHEKTTAEKEATLTCTHTNSHPYIKLQKSCGHMKNKIKIPTNNGKKHSLFR